MTFGSREDRARQLAARHRKTRITSNGSQNSQNNEGQQYWPPYTYALPQHVPYSIPPTLAANAPRAVSNGHPSYVPLPAALPSHPSGNASSLGTGISPSGLKGQEIYAILDRTGHLPRHASAPNLPRSPSSHLPRSQGVGAMTPRSPQHRLTQSSISGFRQSGMMFSDPNQNQYTPLEQQPGSSALPTVQLSGTHVAHTGQKKDVATAHRAGRHPTDIRPMQAGLLAPLPREALQSVHTGSVGLVREASFGQALVEPTFVATKRGSQRSRSTYLLLHLAVHLMRLFFLYSALATSFSLYTIGS